MKILIVSDTHGDAARMKRVIQEEKPIDLLVHCGDSCADLSAMLGKTDYHVWEVRGNCDFRSDAPSEAVFLAGAHHRVFASHGHRYQVDYGLERILYAAREHRADILMFGHTHVPYCAFTEGVFVVNPGSLTRPRQADRRPSYAVLAIDDDGAMRGEVRYPEF